MCEKGYKYICMSKINHLQCSKNEEKHTLQESNNQWGHLLPERPKFSIYNYNNIRKHVC